MPWQKAIVEPIAEPTGLRALTWFHGAEATGHIERLPSGSYRVIVYVGTDPLTGRRLRFRQTVKTEEQAHILLGQMLEQAAEGKQPESGVTVAELLRQYMTGAELDRATRQTYEGYIRRTIVPALGLIKLRKEGGPVLDMLPGVAGTLAEAVDHGRGVAGIADSLDGLLLRGYERVAYESQSWSMRMYHCGFHL